MNQFYMQKSFSEYKNDSFSISESSVGTGAGCFPSGAMVHTEAGPRDISTLQLGDRILAADDSGKTIYSEVRNI